MEVDGEGARPATPRLHVIVDETVCREEGTTPMDLVARIVAAGRPVAVHLRAPGLSAAALWRSATEMRAVVRPPALLIINDRADVAVAAGADGVQLGAQGLPVAAARQVVGGNLLVGRSVHSVEEARDAERQGADYLLLGTIYPTASHPGVAGEGPDLIRTVRASVALPLVVIGGIDQTNIGGVMGAGAAGVAVIRAVAAAVNPAEAVAALYARVGRDVTSTDTAPQRPA